MMTFKHWSVIIYLHSERYSGYSIENVMAGETAEAGKPDRR